MRLGAPAILGVLAVFMLAAASGARAARTPGGPGARAARTPVLAAGPTVVDGPSASIASLSGMSIARDGTGGLAYVRDPGGVAHVFVSTLTGGRFGPPVPVDAGLPGGSSHPVIAAGNGGTLLVAFINRGALYVAQRVGGGAFAAPALLYAGAGAPSISMSSFGKAYLAFTATGGASGGDVRAAYYVGGSWSLVPAPLDNRAADTAGTGAGAPQVATAGDGDGIVAWGEGGHVYTRRVVKTAPSVVDEQADVPSLDGWQEVSAAYPQIATGGNSSYASVAFQERFSNGALQRSRVLMNRLHGSRYDGVGQADGIVMGGPEGADRPQTSDTEYGRGWVLSEHDQTHQLFAAPLSTNDSLGAAERIDSRANSGAPRSVSSAAGLRSTFIAWQQSPGVGGPAEIRLRYAPDGSHLGPEQVVSSPADGATDAAAGLAAGGDVAGDAAVAWVQGGGSGTRIMAAQLYQPPGGFAAAKAFRYSSTDRPTLTWSPSTEPWGAPTYVVAVDGAPAGRTAAPRLTVPALSDGRHSYQVTSINQAGLATAARPAAVFVDTVAPGLSVRIRGSRRVGGRLRLTAKHRDRPPAGLPRSAASGVARVTVRWGDGTRSKHTRRATVTHAYRRRRRYTITVTATDRAGNRRVVRRRIAIGRKRRPGRSPQTPAPGRRAAAAGAQDARMTFARPHRDG